MVFGFLFSGKSSGGKREKVELSPTVRQLIREHLGQKAVPAMPANAQKAFKVASDPKADLRELQEVIESDESFSSRIIKIANSVYYDRGKTAKTVPEALVIIGLTEAKTFLSSSYMSEFFSQTHGLRALLWHHNIAVAILAKWLNSFTNTVDQDLAFLAGLMHDIGKLIMHMRLGQDYEKILDRSTTLGSIEAETEQFPFDHTDVGLFLAEEWRFSDELKRAIKLHHSKTEEGTLEWLVRFADTVSHALAIAHPRGFYKVQQRAKENLHVFKTIIESNFVSISEFLIQAEQNYAHSYDLYVS